MTAEQEEEQGGRGPSDERRVARVSLLSNYRPLNLGNEALTVLMESLLRQSVPGGTVVGVGRPSRGGTPFPTQLDRFVAAWPRRVEKELDRLRQAGPAAAGERVTETEEGPRVAVGLAGERYAGALGTKRRALARRLLTRGPARVVRQRIVDRRFTDDLRVICDSDLAVYNAAGEFNLWGGTVPILRLLELAVAQASGTRTAVVNFTYDPSDDMVAFAAGRVVPEADLVIVRDIESARALEAIGAPADRMQVVPDVVFLADAPGDQATREAATAFPQAVGAWGVVFNALYGAGYVDAFVRIARGLAADGSRVVLLSNESDTDSAMLATIAERAGTGVSVLPQCTSWLQYVGVLANLRGLCSSRLHSGILGIVAGTPVTVLECGSRKFGGAMDTAGLGDLVVDLATVGDEEAVVPRIQMATSVPAQALDRIRSRVREAYRTVADQL